MIRLEELGPQCNELFEVLREARDLASVGDFHQALEKHLWFHHHALELNPAFAGARLSYALRDWVALGRSYPRALEALIGIRDDCERQLRTEQGNREHFLEFRAINRELGDGARTHQLFKWLHTERSDFAFEVYDVAEGELIKAEDYVLCARYLDPNATIERFKGRFDDLQALSDDQRVPHQAIEWMTTNFYDREVLTLIALLIRNNRSGAAQWTRKTALREHDTPEFRQNLERAMKGEFPHESWEVD